MILRRLTATGIDHFTAFLSEVKDNPKAPVPLHLLTAGDTSAALTQLVTVENTTILATRMAAGRFLSRLLPQGGGLENDTGIWAWLSLLFFDQLCPLVKGKRQPGDRARWIPEADNFQRFYRHLLVGPYLIFQYYRKQPDVANVLLCQPVHTPGELVEQFASRQEIMTNRAVIEAATRLYYDPATGTPKKGASTKAAGSARRLASFIGQLDLTWDLYSLTAERFIEFLPPEFDRFR